MDKLHSPVVEGDQGKAARAQGLSNAVYASKGNQMTTLRLREDTPQ